MFCTKCGKQIPDDSKFCSYCGAAVETPEEMQKRIDKSDIENKKNTTPVVANEQPRTSSSKSSIIIATFIALAILLGMLTLAIWPKSQTVPKKPATSTTQTKPTKEAVQKIPAPTSIETFEIDINAIGEPVAKIQIKNNSDKTIDGFKVIVSAKDNFEKDVHEYGSGGTTARLISQRKIAPGAVSDSRIYWTLHGYENGTKFHVKVYEIHYTDGTSWKAAQSDPVESNTVKTDKVIE